MVCFTVVDTWETVFTKGILNLNQLHQNHLAISAPHFTLKELEFVAMDFLSGSSTPGAPYSKVWED